VCSKEIKSLLKWFNPTTVIKTNNKIKNINKKKEKKKEKAGINNSPDIINPSKQHRELISIRI